MKKNVKAILSLVFALVLVLQFSGAMAAADGVTGNEALLYEVYAPNPDNGGAMEKVTDENDLLSGEMLSDEQPETGLPAVQASASVDAEGLIHVTLVNPDLDAARTLDIGLSGHRAASAAGECLTGAMDAHNTFDRPEQVHDVPFDAFELTDAGLRVTLPPVSVVHLAVRLDG